MISIFTKKKFLIYSVFSFCFLFLFLLLPDTGFAQDQGFFSDGPSAKAEDTDLVKCGGSGEGEEMCTVKDFFELVVRVMQWGFRLGVVLATLMFAYAGLLLMSSLGKPAQISKAKAIFLRSAIGIIIMFVSYSLIWFILTRLGVDQTFYQFF